MITQKEIISLLVDLGCEISYRGFRYLADVIEICYNDEKILYNLSNYAYPLIGDKYGIKPKSIERALRTLIENTWNSDPEYIKEISAKRLKQAPSTKQFIAIVISYLKYKRDE